jgi:hypothetical protein
MVGVGVYGKAPAQAVVAGNAKAGVASVFANAKVVAFLHCQVCVLSTPHIVTLWTLILTRQIFNALPQSRLLNNKIF